MNDRPDFVCGTSKMIAGMAWLGMTVGVLTFALAASKWRDYCYERWGR